MTTWIDSRLYRELLVHAVFSYVDTEKQLRFYLMQKLHENQDVMIFPTRSVVIAHSRMFSIPGRQRVMKQPIKATRIAYIEHNPHPKDTIDQKSYKARQSKLEALAKYGMTIKLINSIRIPNAEPFSRLHCDTLIYLITGQSTHRWPLDSELCLSVTAAFEEVSKLNDIQLNTLQELNSLGVRKHHLRQLEGVIIDKGIALGSIHLSCLMRNHILTPEQALVQLANLTNNQREALVLLYKSGLRNEHLLAWQAPTIGEKFEWGHTKPLETLVLFQG